MKLPFLLLFIFLSQIGISQTTKTNYTNLNKLLAEGEKAFSENNFVLAKEIYTKVTDSVSWNHVYLYNLAAVELKLGETDNACEHFYKIYSLNDMKVVKYLAEYCPNYRGENKYSFEEVEEKPKFIYKDKEYPLIKNNNLNPIYLSAINKAFNKSKILKEKSIGRNVLSMSINKNNELITYKIFKLPCSKEDYDLVTTEMMSILKNTVTYIAAKKNGHNVDLWNKWDFLIVVFK